MKQTKNQETNKTAKKNIASCYCKYSKQKLQPNEAICLPVASNNTTYIAKSYINFFKGCKQYTIKEKTKLLTIPFFEDSTLYNKQNKFTYNILSNATARPVFKITMLDNITIDLYQHTNKTTNKISNSNLKAFFNILVDLKNKITKIEMLDKIKNNYIDITNDCITKNTYPTFKMLEYHYFNYHLGYNPRSKKTIVNKW